MSFWNFIGLANKKDIVNLNKQLEYMKTLIGSNITTSDNINTTNNKIKEDMVVGLNNIKEEINDLNSGFNEKIVNFENNNVKNQQLTCDELEKINFYISTLEKNNERDIVNINDILKKMSQDIVETKNTSAANTRNLSKGVSYIKNDINSFKTEVNEKIINFKSESIKGQQVVCDILEKIDVQISKLNEKNQKHTNDLNTILKGMYDDITELKTKTTDITNIINDNKIIKQITKDIKHSQKKIDTLNKEVSIIQQMIRVVWVNDIVDTLENQVSKVKVK